MFLCQITMAPRAPLEPPKPTQSTSREDSRQDYMFIFPRSYEWCERCDVGAIPWHHLRAVIPPTAFWKLSQIYFNQGSLENGFWLRCILGIIPSLCGIFSSENWASQETQGEDIWAAASINQESSGSVFLFVLEKVMSLWWEEDRGQAEQTQDLMLLAVVERLTAHTVPFNNQYCSHYSPAQEMGAVHRQAQTLPCPAQHGPGSLPLWRVRALHHTSPRMNSCTALQAQHNGQICTTLCSAKSQNRGLNPAFLDA